MTPAQTLPRTHVVGSTGAPAVPASRTLEQLIDIDTLPSPPMIAIQIVRLCDEPNRHVDELVRVVSLDVALAARVLRFSNSAAYSRGSEVSTLSQAIVRLGVRTISIVALGFSLKASFPTWKHDSGATDEMLWRRSVSAAVAARAVARLVRYSDHEQAFLCGLLSRLGQLLLFTAAPAEYGQVLTAAAGNIPSRDLEEQFLGFTHHEAGAALVTKWQLPKILQEVIAHWGAPPLDVPLNDETRKLCGIIAVSDAVAQLLLDDNKALGLQRLYSTASERLGLSSGEIDRLFSACGRDVEGTLKVFDLAPDETLNCENILETARYQLVQLSLGLVADLSQERSSKNNLLEENRQLAIASTSDALTGLANRSALDKELRGIEEARAAGNNELAYAIMMIDVDHFKKFNDTYGHAAGDEVLKVVAASLSHSARATDFVARYGGEEFCVVLTNAGRAEAKMVAERFRQSLAKKTVSIKGEELSVTASFGVSCSDSTPHPVTALEVLEQADAALYLAKRQGRNCVVEFTPTDNEQTAGGPTQ